MILNFKNTEALSVLADYFDPYLEHKVRNFFFFKTHCVITEFNTFTGKTEEQAVQKYYDSVKKKIEHEASIFIRVAIQDSDKMTCGQQLELFRTLPYTEDQLNALITILLDSEIIEIRRVKVSRRKRKISYVLTDKYKEQCRQKT